MRRWSTTTAILAAALGACGGEAPSSSPPTPNLDAPVEARRHWAFRPLLHAEPRAVSDPRWNAHPVDRLVGASMHAADVQPLPPVGKTTLARRLYFDLTGLPPSEEEVAVVLDAADPDWVDRLVDRLLASPAHGERWAQHWLDLARYAETDGFEHDLVRPNAWRYRDWVVEAFSRDAPYTEFLRLQLAGDEIQPGSPQAAVATGFLLCGPDMPDINLQEERRHFVLNETTSTVGSVFLGLQLGCAQCHDHKFDPLLQLDFYRLRGFFESMDLFRDHPIPTSAELAARRQAEDSLPDGLRAKIHRRDELERVGRDRLHAKNPDLRPELQQILAELSTMERREHEALLKELNQSAELPELPMGRVARTGATRRVHLYVRGDFRRPADEVDCGWPRLLDSEGPAPTASANSRTALADWMARPGHPIVARVIVNRIWQWHFGVGLCATSSDFGTMGRPPTNPELLDWLARRFIDDDWSFHRMHRLLVTSQTYATAAGPFDAHRTPEQSAEARVVWAASQEKDPDNVALWKRKRIRLDGEAIRDAMLLASGRLSSRRGGPSIRPPIPSEVASTLLKDQWPVNGDEEDHCRRSIYLFVRRNLRYPMFDVFDRPDANASCPVRHESTTATQSLVLMNSDFSRRCAEGLADLLITRAPGDPAQQVEIAYLRVLSRPATPEEVDDATAFLERQRRLPLAAADDAGSINPNCLHADPSVAALADFCLALFNASEFVYLD